MYNLTKKLEQEILFHIWTTRDFLKFALDEDAISGQWVDYLKDHMQDSESLLDLIFDLRSGKIPEHEDLAWPQEDVFI